MSVSYIEKHAPRKLKRISKTRVPWITQGLLHKMDKRDLIKEKAILQTIMTRGSNLNVQETKQIMPLNKQRNATFPVREIAKTVYIK